MIIENEELNINLIEKNVPGIVSYKKITESTNLDAKNSLNVPDKSVYLADMQTGGRGRLGRSWISPAGSGIWMSIYLKPQIPISDISQLTLIAGLSVSRVITDSAIKWPNDVLIKDKKVAGILTEMSVEQNKINYAVVGIGINVNNKDFPCEIIDKATSLYLETKKLNDRNILISKVLEEFFSMYDIFIENGFSVFKDEYEKKCITLNKDVYLIKNKLKQLAKAIGITENGELITEIDGNVEVVNSCEVSVRGLLGYS